MDLRLPDESSTRRGTMSPEDAQIVELMSRRIDADLSDVEGGDLNQILAQDRRAAIALSRMTELRLRVSQDFQAPVVPLTPGFLEGLKSRIALLLSRYPPPVEVFGRVMAAHQADFQLAMDAANGRDEAWNQILQAHGPAISALIYQQGFAGEKDDLLQDIFLLLCRRIDSFRGDSSLKTWIFRVAINHLNNYRLRVHGKRKLELSESQLGGEDEEESISLDDLSADQSPSPDRLLERQLVQETVFAALADIVEEVRTAVILRDLNELSYKEIADIMSIPEGTVKSRVARGRAALAKALVEKGVIGN
jgi:RNA polymerase sigma-70 factor (ECF subfamily)